LREANLMSWGKHRIGACDTFRLGRLCGPELRNGVGFFFRRSAVGSALGVQVPAGA
jgi:hypothetical protein